jgi:HD-like signal output (HDOD) protein/CheY-like chemotaxis protein
MKKILFVDDEPRVLEGLQRMLRGMRNEWEMAFAPSGPEALEILEKDLFDVIVTDMLMPGMDGYQLLNEVKRDHPGIVRIILSGHLDKDKVLNSIGPVHQYLSKPCSADDLKSTIARACAMRCLLENDSLINLISTIDTLPSLPSLYMEIVEEVNSPDGTISRAGEIISKDVSMSTKVLQLVNSSFFGISTHVSIPARAVALIGMETVQALVLSSKIFSQFSRSDLPGYQTIANLWDHSIATGFLAKDMATSFKQGQEEIDDSSLAGFVHDLGKLILLDKLSEACAEVVQVAKSTDCSLIEAEQEVLGTTHAQIGAFLLGIWGFSESIVEGVAFHHCPGECPNKGLSALTAVHLANGLEHRINPHNAPEAASFDCSYLSKLGIYDRIDELHLTFYSHVMGGEANVAKDSFR